MTPVQSAAASVVGTWSKTPVQGNMLICYVYANIGTGTNITIAGWTAFDTNAAGAKAVRGFWKLAGASEPTTFTANATGATIMNIEAMEWSGLAATSPVDITQTANNAGSSGTSYQIPSLTTGNVQELVIAALITTNDHTAPAVDSQFTLDSDTARLMMGWRIAGPVGTFSPTFSWTTASDVRTIISAFKGAYQPALAVTLGMPKIWNGSAWVTKPEKIWTGSAWVQKSEKIWTGSAWVTA